MGDRITLDELVSKQRRRTPIKNIGKQGNRSQREIEDGNGSNNKPVSTSIRIFLSIEEDTEERSAYGAESDVASVVAPVRDGLLHFFVMQTENVRDDYRELIELCINFLCGIPARRIRFTNPGAIHKS